MRCVICRDGETRSGTATVLLERDGLTMVLTGVPAEVCENCGEEYLDEAVSAAALETAKRAVDEGVRVEIRAFTAA